MNNTDDKDCTDDISDMDTIVACATPVGRGGVGVIRISGTGMRVSHIAQHILSLHQLPPPRHAAYVDFLDAANSPIDSGLALYFPAPHSFTGEDVLELHGHGGRVIVDCIIKRVLDLGARLANPGEFSERAFLNGKIDLTQAEAIADLIDANSEQAAHYAVRSLRGEFSRRVHVLSDGIMQLRAAIEAALDFADEDIEFITREELQCRLAQLLQMLRETQCAAQQGVLLNEGISVVIAGEPNVGKSSLLNCLSGEDTAIVASIAGTTRDVLRTHVKLDGGLVLQLVDTAGLRQSLMADKHGDLGNLDIVDIVEREGIRRARAEIAKAQYVLLVVDFAREGTMSPRQLWDKYRIYFDATYDTDVADTADYVGGADAACNRNNDRERWRKLIVVYNKIDLASNTSSEAADGMSLKMSLPSILSGSVAPHVVVIDDIPCVFMSAKHYLGIDLLRQMLRERVGMTHTTEDGFSARRRHLVALADAECHLMQAQKMSDVANSGGDRGDDSRGDTDGRNEKDNGNSGVAMELLAEELREAQQYLGVIIGEVTSDDLLAKIFSEFCIGK